MTKGFNHPVECNKYLNENVSEVCYAPIIILNRSLEAYTHDMVEGSGEFGSTNINYCPVCGRDIRKIPNYYPVVETLQQGGN